MMYIYSQHYMHRDLKTLNILLDENLHPKITDFGLAKHYEKGESENHSRFGGTPLYLAPEVINGERFNEKSDVYSYGIIMYEVVTGCQPFEPGLEKLALWKKILVDKERPKFTINVKKSIKKLIERCWSEDPKERPTFEEIYNKLAYNDEYYIDDSDVSDDDDGLFKYYLDDVDVNTVLNYVDEIDNIGANHNEIVSMQKEILSLQNENKNLKMQLKQLSRFKMIDNTFGGNIIFSLVTVGYFNSLSLSTQKLFVSEILKIGIKNQFLININNLLNGIKEAKVIEIFQIKSDKMNHPLHEMNIKNTNIYLHLFDSPDNKINQEFTNNIIDLIRPFSSVLFDLNYPSKKFDTNFNFFSSCKRATNSPKFEMKINISRIDKEDKKFFENSDINYIEFHPKVIEIPDEGFEGCTELKEVVLPNTLVSIGKKAFSGCTSLNEITVPVTTITINDGAFMGCSSLKYVMISSLLLEIRCDMFAECSQLKQVVIPSSVKTISQNAFKDCSSLSSISLPKSLTYIGDNAFDGCKSLQDVEFKAIEHINDFSFQNCTSFTKIEIPSSIKSIGNCAFKECSSVKKIRIPKSLEHIGNNAFPRCASVETYEHSCCIS